MKIAASFLSCKRIKEGIKKLSLTDVDYIHVDLVDGTLNQGRKIPMRKLKKIYKYTSKRLDVHLMVKNPKKYIRRFALLNTETIVFPIESEKGIEKNLDLIKNYGIKCGLAISPKSELSRLKPYLDKIDVVLVMAIKPGLGGQSFLEETPTRIQILKKMIRETRSKCLISVDGGINEETIKKVKGVDIVVVGSYITNTKDYQEQINKLRSNGQTKEKTKESRKNRTVL